MERRGFLNDGSAPPARPAAIYVLVDSRVEDPIQRVRYVGRTICGLERRLKEHLATARKGEATPRACWMRSVLAAGGHVRIEPLASVTQEECGPAEQRWITHFKALGSRLMNATDGGDGLLNPTPEARRKIGDKKRGHKIWVGKTHTAEARAKISAAAMGRPMHPRTREALKRPEVGAKISAALKGRPLTEAQLRKKRAHVAKHWHSEEAQAKMRATVGSEQHRARLRAKANQPDAIERTRRMGHDNRGRRMSDAFKAGCAERARDRRPGEQTRQKMSAWQRGAGSHRAKLTWAIVRDIRARYASGGVSQHQLARDLSVQPRTINLIVHNKTWRESNATC